MEPFMISNPSLLNCCYCFQSLTIPVCQCDNGHIVCSTCCPKLRNKCNKCSLSISSKRCTAIENLLQSIKISCPNAKLGCIEKISYTRKRKHEEECIYDKCYCPISDCGFFASLEVLSNHFSRKHKDSQIKFSCGRSFIVPLKSTDETIVLQEENDGRLFILNHSIMTLGNVVNICCIGPNTLESEYNYDILVKSEIGKLKLQSFVKNVRRFTLGTISSGSLVIPVGSSSESLKLEICITSPMMEIHIRTLTRVEFELRVKRSVTIVNVKKMIHKKIGIRVQDQSLIFDGKQLDDNLTLADYNIQEKSIIYFVLHLSGS
ncbi:E3 ubiquitin-protein ligase SINA [Trifolium repens]|nr:E3 ubiquitin-protein ligase SINA [Trifolium repens]